MNVVIKVDAALFEAAIEQVKANISQSLDAALRATINRERALAAQADPAGAKLRAEVRRIRKSNGVQ